MNNLKAFEITYMIGENVFVWHSGQGKPCLPSETNFFNCHVVFLCVFYKTEKNILSKFK